VSCLDWSTQDPGHLDPPGWWRPGLRGGGARAAKWRPSFTTRAVVAHGVVRREREREREICSGSRGEEGVRGG